ncbi:uncharacterized protein LOC134254982 [Saccostrea cucullata]|uniref:uncharacterized protein LOC134254982 n=1 Tax=Saccostrea cuccullata TaxID=36930 RepID=UPI002ED0FFE2
MFYSVKGVRKEDVSLKTATKRLLLYVNRRNILLSFFAKNPEEVSMTEFSTQTATESYTESERSDLNSTNITSKNSSEVSMTEDSTQTATESLDLNSTNITSNQSGADKREIIITVSTITTLLLILFLSAFCFVR